MQLRPARAAQQREIDVRLEQLAERIAERLKSGREQRRHLREKFGAADAGQQRVEAHQVGRPALATASPKPRAQRRAAGAADSARPAATATALTAPALVALIQARSSRPQRAVKHAPGERAVRRRPRAPGEALRRNMVKR
jgi:hypothetical protein